MSLPKDPNPDPTGGFGPVAHQVPIADILDDVYALTDGSLTAVFRCRALEYASVDDSTFTQWDQGLRSVLNAMTPGLNLKVIYRAHHNYRDVLDAYVQQANGGNGVARYILLEEAEAWREEMNGKRLIRSEVLFAFTFKPRRSMQQGLDNPLRAALHLLGPQGGLRAYQRTVHEHQEALRQLEQALNPAVTALKILEMEPTRLTTRELECLAYEVLNPARAMSEPAPELLPPGADAGLGALAGGPGQALLRQHPEAAGFAPYSVREQLCLSDWVVREKFVEIDGVYHGVVSMRVLPDMVHEGMVLHLCNLAFAQTVTVDCLMLNKTQEQESLWRSVKMAESAAGATLLANTTPDPAETERAAEARQRYLAMASAGENPFLVRVLVTVQADSARQLDERCQHVIAAMRRMNNMTGSREQWAVDTLLKAAWPFGLLVTRNTRKLMTSEVSTVLPVFGGWEGTRRPVALFRSPTMRLIRYDPFNSDLANKNRLVMGKSGSGKSVAAQLTIALPMLARNSEIIVVDSGGSFLASTMAVEGSFLQVGPKSQFFYNVFELPPELLDLPDQDRDAVLTFKTATVKDVVLIMSGITDARDQRRVGGVITEMVKTLLDDCVDRVARRSAPEGWSKQMPRLRDLHRLLGEYRNPADPEVERLVRTVYTDIRPYVVADGGRGTAGVYASIFDTYTNFDPSGQLITFEMGDVKMTPDLMNPLAVILIAGLTYNRLLRRDGKEKVIILDEAWALLEHPAAKAAIIRFYREGRKFSVGTTLLTQNWSDLVNHPDADALIGNASERLFLAHLKTPQNTKAFQSTGLNDVKMNQIYELHQERGSYSEIMLNVENTWAVARLEPTPFRLWLATTHPADLRARDQYLDIYHRHYGLSWAQVLFILAADYPRGVDASRDHPKLSEQAALALATQFKLRCDALAEEASAHPRPGH